MTSSDAEHWREILEHNEGFDDPERWLEYARSHGFRKVATTRVARCPDCGGLPSPPLGQYVYYSNRVGLRICDDCGLVFADLLIDPALIQDHFEGAYKDEAYFVGERGAIFSELCRHVTALSPPGGSVLDVGGARGHLIHRIRELRPDLRFTLSDLSEKACEEFQGSGAGRAICCAAARLADRAGVHDVVVMSDVAYYEPDLPGLWRAAARCTAPGGALVLRLPNRMAWLRGACLFQRLRESLPGQRPGTSIRFFNPEHLYVFSRAYLRCRLAASGFSEVTFHGSPLLARGDGSQRLSQLQHRFAQGAGWLTRGRMVPSAAMIVVARRDPEVSEGDSGDSRAGNGE